jgi:hypothetical protein
LLENMAKSIEQAEKSENQWDKTNQHNSRRKTKANYKPQKKPVKTSLGDVDKNKSNQK